MTVLFDRCDLCPRDRPGLCFAQTRGKSFCERHAAGDPKRLPLLRGDVEPDEGGMPLAPTPVPCVDTVRDEAKRRALLCPHRTPTSTCQCSGFCAKGRGDRVDYETGPRTVANLDTCLACPDLPA